VSIRLTTLRSGLRVVSDPMPTVETASVGVWVTAGTRHERPEVNGVSHLLEHMAFKGTRRRSARDIAEEIEAVGGHLNAYTTRESTAYYAKVLKEDVPLALDMIADILQNSVMDGRELAREREVIIQEILQSRDTPDDIIFDHFQETAFPGQAIGRPVLGLADVVGDMSRRTVLGFLRRHYSAPRMILAAAGRIDHDALVKAARRLFGALPPYRQAVGEPARYVGGDFRETKPLEQVQAVLGFDGVSYDDPDFYAISVLSTLFGGGMSSRLFQEVREKHGLAYSIYSFSSSYTDAGLFGIHAGTGEREVAELLPVVVEEIAKVCRAVDADEVARARAQLKASILMSLESTSARCEQLARQLMVFGRVVPVPEVIRRIEAVDGGAVMKVARRIFASRPTLAVLGPVGRVAPYADLARWLSEGKVSRSTVSVRRPDKAPPPARKGGLAKAARR
jgi:predicted Zn-dependent peptidase